jgi:hypothetical protein
MAVKIRYYVMREITRVNGADRKQMSGPHTHRKAESLVTGLNDDNIDQDTRYFTEPRDE